jgi:hypothetical protein
MAWFSSMRFEDKLSFAFVLAALLSMYLIVANGWFWVALA